MPAESEATKEATSRVREVVRAARYQLRELVAAFCERRVPAPRRVETEDSAYRVLFVCRGNICRSPTAVGVLREQLAASGLAQRISVESAGTHVGRPGRRPEPRARREAARHGLSIGDMSARQLTPRDLQAVDRVVVFDSENLADVQRLAREHGLNPRVGLLRSNPPTDIADPVARGTSQFAKMFDEVGIGCRELIPLLQAEIAERE